jgi:hypothetical protein
MGSDSLVRDHRWRGAADHEDKSKKHAVDLEADRPQPGDSPDADP